MAWITISANQSSHRNLTKSSKSTWRSGHNPPVQSKRLGLAIEREQVRQKATSPYGPLLPPRHDQTESGKRRRGAAMTRQGDRLTQVGVNLPELLLRVENDLDLLGELIGIFREEFPRLLQCLQDSITREDMKNVEAASHALKGMLSGLSVTQAAATASR